MSESSSFSLIGANEQTYRTIEDILASANDTLANTQAAASQVSAGVANANAAVQLATDRATAAATSASDAAASAAASAASAASGGGSGGAVLRNGAGAPSNTLGINGDFYIDTAANVLYGPKAANVWSGSGVSIVGPAGATGAAGAQGATGAAGPAGSQGAQGATGAAGPAGTPGNTVLNGSGAPAAGSGANGDFYLDTAASKLYGPKVAGAWPGSGVSLIGPTGLTGGTGATGPKGDTGATGSAGAAGSAGTNGNTILSGAGAPSNTLGANGDFYLDTTASKLYGPKAAGAWPGAGTSLVGPPGATGAAGQAVRTISLYLDPPSDGTYRIIQSAPYSFVINGLHAVLTGGTCTVAVKINGTSVTGLSGVAASTTDASGTATAANSVAAGDHVEIGVSAGASAAGLTVTMSITQ